MTGSIQTKNGRKNYYAVLNAYDENGKRKLKWVDTGVPIKGNNERKATAKLNELLTNYDRDGIDITKDSQFSSFLVQWLETLRPTISPTTYDAYNMTMNAHILPHFEKKNLKIAEITPMIIQRYVNIKLKELSPNTVRKHLANISKCLDSAVRQNIIAYNPVKRIDLPKKVKFTGAKHYNETLIEKLLEYSKNDPLEVVISLTLFYGLRRSEVLGLKWSAVDFNDKTITISHTVVKLGNITHKQDRTKNDSSYAKFPMPNKISFQLKKWKEEQLSLKSLQPKDYYDSDYIFTKVNGKLLSPDYISQHFALLLKKNNMPHIRFHDLRHSSASYLKSLGI